MGLIKSLFSINYIYAFFNVKPLEQASDVTIQFKGWGNFVTSQR